MAPRRNLEPSQESATPFKPTLAKRAAGTRAAVLWEAFEWDYGSVGALTAFVRHSFPRQRYRQYHCVETLDLDLNGASRSIAAMPAVAIILDERRLAENTRNGWLPLPVLTWSCTLITAAPLVPKKLDPESYLRELRGRGRYRARAVM